MEKAFRVLACLTCLSSTLLMLCDTGNRTKGKDRERNRKKKKNRKKKQKRINRIT